MKRYYIVYEGQVQGVGFRGTMISLARKHDLTGYVRKDSLSDRYFIKVKDYSIKQIPVIENEKQFTVRF